MNTDKDRKYITQEIGEDYITWNPGDFVILRSGTDTGKTTFLFVLARYCMEHNKSILYLVSRTAKERELKGEVKLRSEQDNLRYFKCLNIMTYQKIEAMTENGSSELLTLRTYDYIFADECHYFVDDSAIDGSNSEISFRFLMGCKQSIRIMASATADYLYEKLIKKFNIPENHIYSVEKTYDYVNALYFFKKEQTTEIIDNILRNESDSKILVFVSNTDQMDMYSEIYGYEIADYLCSKNTHDNRMRRICNMKSDDEIVINKRILFATKTIDVGVNIKDPNLRHIICHLQDVNTITQCFGRKRPVNNDDVCTLYLEEKRIQVFGKQKGRIDKALNDYKEYCEDPQKFLEKRKDSRSLNKDGSVFVWTHSKGLTVNEVRVYNYKLWEQFYDEVKKEGYMAAVTNRLDEGLKEKVSIYTPPVDMFLEKLKTFENRRLFAEDKEELKKLFINKMSELHQTHKTYGIKTLNDFLTANYKGIYDRKISNGTDRRRSLENGEKNPNRDKAYWFIG